MSKYSHIVNGKVLDYRFQKHHLGYNFYLGDTMVAQLFKQRNTWGAVVQGDLDGALRLVGGFATRLDAVQYALKAHRLTRDSFK